MQWAKEHIEWSEDQWKQVIWSDESRISLFGSDRRKYVRRRVGEELHPECFLASAKNPTSVMVWGCMTAGGIGSLHVIDGILNGRKYINDILEAKLLPSIRDQFPNNVPLMFSRIQLPATQQKYARNGSQQGAFNYCPG